MTPKIRLEGRNEGLSYEDSTGTYRFNIALNDKTWVVQLPPTKDVHYQRHTLSEQERATLLPEIKAFLSRIRWFGIWPCKYGVTFRE